MGAIVSNDESFLISIVEEYLNLHNIEEIIKTFPEEQLPLEARNSLIAYQTKSYRLNWILLTSIVHDIVAGKFLYDGDIGTRQETVSKILDYMIYSHKPVDIGDFPNYNFSFANINRLIRETKVLDDDNPAKWTLERKEICMELYKQGLIYHAFVVYTNFYWAWYLYRIRPLGYELTDIEEDIIKVKYFLDTFLLFTDISFWYSNYLLLLHNPMSKNDVRYVDELFKFILSKINSQYIDLEYLFFEEFKVYRVNQPLTDDELFSVIIPKDEETGKYIAITNVKQKEEYMVEQLQKHGLAEEFSLNSL